MLSILRPARPCGMAISRKTTARPTCRDGSKFATRSKSTQIACRAQAENGETYDYDLLTIGGGSGGVRASRIAAQLGAKVACVELPFGYVSSESVGGLGGTCVLRGCVPKKLVLYCSEYAEFFRDAEGFGWSKIENPQLDWSKFMEKKRAELKRLNGVYSNILKNAGVECIEGRAKVVDPHTVDVDGKRYSAKYICIAVGGSPVFLPIPGVEHAINSDGILELAEVPKRLAVIGGGYIGVEFAGMFRNLGTQVDIFIRGTKVLTGFDDEVRDFLTEEYKKHGVVIKGNCNAKKIVKEVDGTLTMTYSTPDGGEDSSPYDQILFATGRQAKTSGLGLEECGVELDKKGGIVVDEYSKSTCDSIYAIGDVTNRLPLTPVALMEGTAMAHTLFGDEPRKPDHMSVPTAVFSHPAIGTVGYSESAAVEEFGDVDVYSSSFRPMRNTISGNESRALMKLLVDAKTDRVVGVHMVGPEAGEIMQGFGVAVKMGATKKQVDSTIGIHPTSAEELVTMRTITRKYRNKELVQ